MASFPCASCGSGVTKVINSRPRGNTIRRRRECPGCSVRFTTTEHLEGAVSTADIIEDLDRQKLISLNEAMQAILKGNPRRLGRMKVVFTPDMDRALLDLHSQGMGQNMIAQHIGVDTSVISRRKKELGLPRLKPFAAFRASQEGRS